MRPKIARWLVKLAARVDNRPNICYEIQHHHPSTWDAIKGLDLTRTKAEVDRDLRRHLRFFPGSR